MPGWTNHGGGGNGHVDCDSSCYLELDFGNASRAHNSFYLPANVLALLFDLRRSDASDNDQLVVKIADQTVATISLATEDAAFATQLIPIPPKLRDQSQVVEFAILAGGFAVDSEIRIDNVRLGTWQNPALPSDVNADRLVVAGDVLLIINEINDPRISVLDGSLPTTGAIAFGPPFFDVNGVQFIGPLDVLIVINHINSVPAEGEGESGLVAVNRQSQSASSITPLSRAPNLSTGSAKNRRAVSESAIDLPSNRSIASKVAERRDDVHIVDLLFEDGCDSLEMLLELFEGEVTKSFAFACIVR